MPRKTKRVDGVSSHFEIEMKYPAWYNTSSTRTRQPVPPRTAGSAQEIESSENWSSKNRLSRSVPERLGNASIGPPLPKG